jgi:hypothetical protein
MPRWEKRFGYLGLFGTAAIVLIAACTTQQVATSQATLATLCQAYAKAAPSIVPPPAGSADAITLSYAAASCNADGTVSASLPSDTPPQWLADVLSVAKVVVPIVLPALL